MEREIRCERDRESGSERSRERDSVKRESGIGTRGQTNVLGVVLLVGFVAVGIGGIVVLGSTALEHQQSAAEAERAERSLLEFGHTIETIADTDRKRADVATGRFDHGRAELRTDAGHVTVTYIDDSGAEEVLYDESLGALVYVDGDTEIAYQGGGVWRTDGAGATAVSPPGIRYREGTLTLPVYRLTGDRVSGNAVDGTVRRSSGATPIEPENRSVGTLEGGRIRIDLESEYCEAWQRELEETLEGSVVERCGEDRPQSVRAELPIHPGPERYDSAVIAETIDAGFEGNQTQIEGDVRAGAVDGWLVDGDEFDEGYVFPEADERIAEKTEACDAALPDEREIDDPGTYCVDELTGGYEFDTADGDIDVVVRDSLDLPTGQGDLLAEGDHDLTFYVDGDVSIEGNARIGNRSDPARTRLVVSSNSTVATAQGSSEIAALIYAPESTVTLRGNPTIEGSVVGGDVTVESNLNPGEIRYDERLESVDFVPSSKPEIRYATITAHEIAFDG